MSRDSEAMCRALKEAERRVLIKVKARMTELQKDKKLEAETLRDLQRRFRVR